MKKIATLLLVGILALCTVACVEESVTSVEEINMTLEESPEKEPVESSLEPAEETAEETAAKGYEVYGTINMNTVALDGSNVTNDVLKGYKVTMVNIWAPWCGPCVGEMPELEELYQNYKNQGFQILGAVPDLKDPDMQWAIDYTGITYPVIAVDIAINKYATEYVPTTFFLDEDGNVLSSESFIGAMSYKNWEDIVKGYLATVSE